MTGPMMKLVAGGCLLVGWLVMDALKIDDPSLKLYLGSAAGVILGHSMKQGE